MVLLNKKILLVILVCLLVAIIVTGCIPGSNSYTYDSPAGFFSGIFHGWIAPATLVVGVFNENVRMYEVVNSGWTYDIGFLLALLAMGRGGFSKKRKHT